MLRRSLLLAAALGMGALTGGPPAGADELAERLLEKSRRLAAQSLTGELSLTMTRGEQTQQLSGRVRLKRPNLGRVELGQPGGPGQILHSDGQRLFVLLPAAQQYINLGEGSQFLSQLNRLATPAGAFLDPASTFSTWKEPARAPAQTIEGRKYEVIRFKTGMNGGGGVAYFEPSGLLAGVELRSEEGGKVTQSAWLRKVKLDVPMKASEFTFKAPQGYTVYEQPDYNKSLLAVGKTAPDFLLPQPGGLGNLALSTAGKDKKAVLINFWFYG